MGWLSDLLGGSKEDRALADAVGQIRRIVEDENFQNSLMHPMVKEMILKGASVDTLPNSTGEFGYSLSNPIPVNGSIGEIAYLSKLETHNGQRILFHRLGSIDQKDVFEAVTWDGSEWFIIFADLYHPQRSKIPPKGFRFFKELGQFTGFHNFCPNFPYDFRDNRHSKENDLSLAYIASGKVQDFMDRKAYQRPLAHRLKLELIQSRLQGIRTVGSGEIDDAMDAAAAQAKKPGEPPLPENMADTKDLLIEILKAKYAKFPILSQDRTLIPAVDQHYLRIYPQMRLRHRLQDIVDEAFRLAFPPNGVPVARQAPASPPTSSSNQPTLLQRLNALIESYDSGDLDDDSFHSSIVDFSKYQLVAWPNSKLRRPADWGNGEDALALLWNNILANGYLGVDWDALSEKPPVWKMFLAALEQETQEAISAGRQLPLPNAISSAIKSLRASGVTIPEWDDSEY